MIYCSGVSYSNGPLGTRGYFATRSKFPVISFLSRLSVGVLSSVFESRCISVFETGQESRILYHVGLRSYF